jgi:hypothetical protein
MHLTNSHQVTTRVVVPVAAQVHPGHPDHRVHRVTVIATTTTKNIKNRKKNPQ